jgi:hypothetical protein
VLLTGEMQWPLSSRSESDKYLPTHLVPKNPGQQADSILSLFQTKPSSFSPDHRVPTIRGLAQTPRGLCRPSSIDADASLLVMCVPSP